MSKIVWLTDFTTECSSLPFCVPTCG